MVKAHGPNQRDIARIAGVSQAVVSMVITGKADHYSIAAETQDRVRDVIRELNYVPNVAGQSLRNGRSGLIGVHTYEAVFPVGTADYYHEFLVGIEEEAVRRKKDLVLFASTQDSGGARRVYTADGNRLRLADGAVILGALQRDEELAALAEEGYPFVYVGRRSLPDTEVACVIPDYASAVSSIVDRLCDLGHTDIGYVAQAARLGPQVEREVASISRLAEHGLALASHDVVSVDEVDAGWLARKLDDGVTSLLIESPAFCGALARAISEIGVSVPEQLSIVVLDEYGGEALPQWDRLCVPRRELGVAAVRMLLDILEGEPIVDGGKVFACSYQSSGSIAPVRVRTA